MKFMTRLKKGHKLTRFGLALAYAGLLVLFACPLATSTLAWFSIGNYTRVRNIQFGFDPESEFHVQLKDLSTGIWIDPDEDNYFRFSDEFTFSPVSSMFESKWYNASLDPESDMPRLMLGYSDASGSTTTSSYATPNSEYVSLEFRFSCDEDVYIFLGEEETVVEADAEANSSVAGSDSSRLEELNRIDKACRISFFSNMGYTIFEPNAEKGSTTYYGGRLNANPCDGYWDADSGGKEILYGEYKEGALEKLQYQEVTEQETVGDPDETMSAVSKKGNQAITEESLSSLKEEGLIEHETSYTLSELGNRASTKHPILFVPARQTRRLVVSVYIEGWDLDCDTFVSSATLAASISFSGIFAPKGYGMPSPVLGSDAA